MRRPVALLVLVVLVLASCGGDDAVGTDATGPAGSTDPTRPSDPGGSTDPSGAADEVIRISVGGAYSPFGTDFAAVPTLVLADGTAFTAGATTLQFPGPPITPVSTGRLSTEQVAQLVDAAKAARLTTPRDYGEPGITDVGTTTISVVVDGTTSTVDVYALGYEDGTGGITDAQREARAQVSAFVGAVGDAVSAAATDAFEPTAYQVLATPAPPASGSEDPEPNVLDWPVASRPLAEGACQDLAGPDAEAFRTALAEASQITVWRSGGEGWQVIARATLPGDAPCASADGSAP